MTLLFPPEDTENSPLFDDDPQDDSQTRSSRHVMQPLSRSHRPRSTIKPTISGRQREPIAASVSDNFDDQPDNLPDEPNMSEISPAQKTLATSENLADDATERFSDENLPRAAHREADPLVAYLLIISLAIGIVPLEPQVRYTFLWVLMGGLGAVAYLLGGIQRMREARIDDLVWGGIFGIFASLPFLIVFSSQLDTVSGRMFDVEGVPSEVMDTWVLMAVAFVVPFTETLFFRGGMQGVRSILLTTGLATMWSAVIFFPHMALGGSETIGIILLVVFALLNFMYSYTRFRYGLAAAWLCQTVSYTLFWFVPRLL